MRRFLQRVQARWWSLRYREPLCPRCRRHTMATGRRECIPCGRWRRYAGDPWAADFVLQLGDGSRPCR